MTLLSIHDAKLLFGLNSIDSLNKVKILAAFRAYVFQHHQDTSGNKHDMDYAVRAKNLLLAHVPNKDTNTITINGEPLSAFGNGLPCPKSGKECVDCSGRGYHKYAYQSYIKCPSCKGKNFYCYRCFGSGEVRSAKASVKYLACSQCHGSGEVEIFNPLIPKQRLA